MSDNDNKQFDPSANLRNELQSSIKEKMPIWVATILLAIVGGILGKVFYDSAQLTDKIESVQQSVAGLKASEDDMKDRVARLEAKIDAEADYSSHRK